MNLDEAQRNRVTGWIAEGLKLSEIQSRLAAELGVRMTYMEVRFLVDDLKLTPKDTEPAKPTESALNHPATPAADAHPGSRSGSQTQSDPLKAPGGKGNVSVNVDQITRPGAVVSGKVTFTDGNTAEWYFDQTGRLALSPQQSGYRPPEADLRQFQMALENELSKLGF